MKGSNPTILDAEVAGYLERIESPRDALLAEMEAYAQERREPISDPEVASFLAITTRFSGAKHIVEVGTNIGYGAIVLARAAGPDARVLTMEIDGERVKVAQKFVDRAGLSAQVQIRETDALAALAAITEPIDLVYIDCVKEHYPAYFDLVVPKLAPKGVLIADNVLWRGLVGKADVPADQLGRVTALRTFNHMVTTDARLRGVILPLGDGVAYAVRT